MHSRLTTAHKVYVEKRRHNPVEQRCGQNKVRFSPIGEQFHLAILTNQMLGANPLPIAKPNTKTQ